MSLGDKIGNKTEELAGKAKEAAGTVAGDDELRAEGKVDQVVAGVKDAVTDVKDAAGKLMDKAKDALGRS